MIVHAKRTIWNLFLKLDILKQDIYFAFLLSAA